MKQWLNSVQWYYTNALNLALPFERFLSAPVIQHHWKVRTEDSLLTRFWLMWRLFNEVGKWNRNMVGILPCSRNNLFGGISGTSFLVYASGLDQPKARSGSIHIECDSPKAISHELVRWIMPFQASEYLSLAFLYDSLFFLPCLFCKRVSVLPEYGSARLSLRCLTLPYPESWYA